MDGETFYGRHTAQHQPQERQWKRLTSTKQAYARGSNWQLPLGHKCESTMFQSFQAVSKELGH